MVPFVDTIVPMAKSAKRAAPPKRPPKPTKDKSLRIRVTQDQHDIIEAAATRAGITMSSWIVALALREAKKDQG